MAVQVGDKVNGKVTGITKFGAFVSLETGDTGLVHISEVAEGFVKDINDVLRVEDTVTVKVLSIADGKINLSIRQAQEKPERVGKTEKDDTPRKLPKFSETAKKKNEDFDALMNAFLKDSDERLLSLKRNTEGKRGGRGGRRS